MAAVSRSDSVSQPYSQVLTGIVRKVATDLCICSRLERLHFDGAMFVYVRRAVSPRSDFVHLASTLDVRPAEADLHIPRGMKPFPAYNLIIFKADCEKAKISTSDI